MSFKLRMMLALAWALGLVLGLAPVGHCQAPPAAAGAELAHDAATTATAATAATAMAVATSDTLTTRSAFSEPRKPRHSAIITSGTVRFEDTPTTIGFGVEPGSINQRPLMAIGTLTALEPTSGLLRLAIDRSASLLPNSLAARARKAGQTTAVLEREFPAEREYRLERFTQTFDGRPRPGVREARASSGRIDKDPRRLPLSAFAVGDRVSVLYRMAHGNQPPHVINMSKLAPGQRIDHLDFNPFGGTVIRRQRTYVTDDGTTHTTTTVTLKPEHKRISPPVVPSKTR